MQNKIIGIIGGIAPPSTMDYYQKIIKGFHEKTQTNQYPSILINSINMTKMLDLVFKKDFTGLVKYLKDEIQKLINGGAEFAVLASNTPHIVFEQLQKKTKIPLISIVDATAKYAKSRGLKKPGLLGLKSTMQSGFYQAGFAKENMDLVIPSLKSQEFIHDKYMSELVKGIFLPETKKALIEIVNGMVEQDNIDGLVLGGTELPLILQEKDFKDLVLLNTTEIHVESILEYALKN
jgi:aspartate racemase